MAREPVYLLPATDELSILSDPTAIKALEVIDHANRREHSYASLAMVCGTAGLMTCVLTFAWLAETGHPQAGDWFWEPGRWPSSDRLSTHASISRLPLNQVWGIALKAPVYTPEQLWRNLKVACRFM